MPIATVLLMTFTLLTIAIVWVAVLYTFIRHHARPPVLQTHLVRPSWVVDMAWACTPWLIVLLLIYPTLKKILM